MIKGTIGCVLSHTEVTASSLLERPLSAIRSGKGVRLFTHIRDQCHIHQPCRQSIMTSDFVGCFHNLQRGDSMAKGRVSIVVEHCKACGLCVEFCPSHVLALSSAFNSKGYHPPHVVHPEKCSGCDLCGMYCPDFAIYATKVAPDKGGNK